MGQPYKRCLDYSFEPPAIRIVNICHGLRCIWEGHGGLQCTIAQPQADLTEVEEFASVAVWATAWNWVIRMPVQECSSDKMF